VEERTGADGLIVPGRGPASARVALALAAVAALGLLIAGCGGGDEDSSEATTGAASAKEVTGNKGPDANDPTANQASGKSRDAGGSPGDQASQGQGSQGAPAQRPAGETVPQATPAEQAQATVADIVLTSPALSAGNNPPTLPAPYTCDGKDSWPALQWQGVPADTEELILFAMNLAPVDGELFFDWALAGLDPSLSGIEAGELPRGAIGGTNGFGDTGYSICPSKGKSETYVFALHAVPTALEPPRGFDPGQLRQRVLEQAGNAGVLVFGYGRGAN
jgi:phosphatidylethanolamine-binding protein (PEBP) family uncharacterized protein